MNPSAAPLLPGIASALALGLAAALGLPLSAMAAPLSAPPMQTVGAQAGGTVSGAPASAATAWRQQFDDPVLTALLAPLAPQDDERAQALARQWVAVRVFHAQWSVAGALARLTQDAQSALMDLPPETEGRAERLAQVASELEQTRRLAADRAARRDQAVAAVAQLTGTTPQALAARVGASLSEWRLPHWVAEPPTLRLTVSPATSGLVQRLSALHARHEAALQADRAVQAARLQLAQLQARTQADQGSDAAAMQTLLLALNAQASAAGDLALAWLDYLAMPGADTPSSARGAGPLSRRSAPKPV